MYLIKNTLKIYIHIKIPSKMYIPIILTPEVTTLNHQVLNDYYDSLLSRQINVWTQRQSYFKVSHAVKLVLANDGKAVNEVPIPVHVIVNKKIYNA